ASPKPPPPANAKLRCGDRQSVRCHASAHFRRISYRMPAPSPITVATREDSMKWQLKLCAVFVAGVAGLATPPAQAQLAGKYLAPKDQVVAIRAGRLFDARSG